MLRRSPNHGFAPWGASFPMPDTCPPGTSPEPYIAASICRDGWSFSAPTPSRTPPIELAPVETLKDGRRGIALPGASSAPVQFGEQRAAAYVRPAGPGAVLLTTTSALTAGSYALNAGGGYELAISQ